MEVIKFTPQDSGNLKGFLAIKTSEGFELKGFKLLQGEKGLFVGAPSQKGKDGKWYDLVWIPKELGAELIEMVANKVDLSSDEVPF